jgi:ketosteroid isomerase-like protein
VRTATISHTSCPGRVEFGDDELPGGARLDAQFCHEYRFRDGKVVSFQQYTDSAQWARLMA